MFDNLCKSWPRESQQCINRLKNKQTSYRVLNTVLIKVLYERCGSWPQKCYGDGYSTGWLRHFIATRRYEFFNFRSAEARSVVSTMALTQRMILDTLWYLYGPSKTAKLTRMSACSSWRRTLTSPGLAIRQRSWSAVLIGRSLTPLTERTYKLA